MFFQSNCLQPPSPPPPLPQVIAAKKWGKMKTKQLASMTRTQQQEPLSELKGRARDQDCPRTRGSLG